MKVIALSTTFFNCGWNIFDLIIVSASLLDLSFEMIDGLSVLRSLRLVSRNIVKRTGNSPSRRSRSIQFPTFM